MSDPDELRRLRDADPVNLRSIPSSDEPAARALRERIVMSEIKTSWVRSRAAALTAAAAAVLLAGTGLVLATRGTPEPLAGGNEPITPGGLASCVEIYSLDALTNREVAFDGTVSGVSGDEVTFEVGEWFKGGSGPEATLAGAGTIGGLTSAGDPLSLEPGTRLLVAGDGGFAWSCGFTQPFDAALAADWREALR